MNYKLSGFEIKTINQLNQFIHLPSHKHEIQINFLLQTFICLFDDTFIVVHSK